MTEQERPRATDEALSPEAIKARISDFCAWSGADMPKLRTRAGSIVFNDELHAWFTDTGASFDWIICGDVKGMALAYAQSNLSNRKVIECARHLDDAEKEALLTALTLVMDDGVPMEAALEAFRKVGAGRRARAM